MASMPEADVKASLELTVQACAVARPGDTLLVAVPDQHVTAQQAKQLADQVEAGLPGVTVRVLVGVTAFAVYAGADIGEAESVPAGEEGSSVGGHA